MHAIENTVADTIHATYARRMMGKLNITPGVEYKTAILYSDWLYSVWHGINKQ